MIKESKINFRGEKYNKRTDREREVQNENMRQVERKVEWKDRKE